MTKHSLIIEHPAVVFTVPDPSVKRLKCSWHLRMMMRIIEMLSLKRQADARFALQFAPRAILYFSVFYIGRPAKHIKNCPERGHRPEQRVRQNPLLVCN
jgi:hypothetical protein